MALFGSAKSCPCSSWASQSSALLGNWFWVKISTWMCPASPAHSHGSFIAACCSQPLQVCPNQLGSSLRQGCCLYISLLLYGAQCPAAVDIVRVMNCLFGGSRGADVRLAEKFGFFHKPERAFWPTQYLVKTNKIFAFAWVTLIWFCPSGWRVQA